MLCFSIFSVGTWSRAIIPDVIDNPFLYKSKMSLILLYRQPSVRGRLLSIILMFAHAICSGTKTV